MFRAVSSRIAYFYKTLVKSANRAAIHERIKVSYHTHRQRTAWTTSTQGDTIDVSDRIKEFSTHTYSICKGSLSHLIITN